MWWSVGHDVEWWDRRWWRMAVADFADKLRRKLDPVWGLCRKKRKVKVKIHSNFGEIYLYCI